MKIQRGVQAQDKSCYGQTITIDILTDNVLLEIFDWCRMGHDPNQPPFSPVWIWHRLVHVCQRWRQLVFESPRRLDLQILCTNGTRLMENLDLWPPLPIALRYPLRVAFTAGDEDSLFTALEYPGRIRHIHLCLSYDQLFEVSAVMKQPFPALTHLSLSSNGPEKLLLPAHFLGGSAPALQYFGLEYIFFPALPALLSTFSDLEELYLDKTSYISPEAMVSCLAALPRLKFLFIGSLFGWEPRISSLPPVTRTLLPALTAFRFNGENTYLEDVVSRIESPHFRQIFIHHVTELLDSQVAQLFKFIDHSRDPEMRLFKYADVKFSLGYRKECVNFTMHSSLERGLDSACFTASSVFCQGIERQMSQIATVFSQPSATVSRVLHLKLAVHSPRTADCFNHDLLPLLRSFSTVRTLHVSRDFARHVALALENTTVEVVTDVFPVLDLIFLDGQPVSSVEKFLAARQLSGHPVTVIDTEAEFDERVKSYVE